MIKYFVNNRIFNKNNILQFCLSFNNNITNIEIFLIRSIILDVFMKNKIINLITS